MGLREDYDRIMDEATPKKDALDLLELELVEGCHKGQILEARRLVAIAQGEVGTLRHMIREERDEMRRHNEKRRGDSTLVFALLLMAIAALLGMVIWG